MTKPLLTIWGMAPALAICMTCGNGTLLGDVVIVAEHEAAGHDVRPVGKEE